MTPQRLLTIIILSLIHILGFTKDGQRLVGQMAKRQAVSNPARTVASIKRHMGEAGYRVEIDDKKYSPEEISAMVLQKLKADAEKYLGETVTQAVITVPALSLIHISVKRCCAARKPAREWKKY